MNGTYYLNRLRVTGKLDETTPHCVVSEILKAHSVCIYKPITTIAELINEIARVDSYRTITFNDPPGERDIRQLATYVNYDCKMWTKSSLIKAYNHMMTFDKTNLKDIVYGQKSYDNIEAYNTCMLYALCKHYKLETRWNTTVEQMVDKLRNLTLSLVSLREQVTSYLSQATKTNLINLLGNIGKTSDTPFSLPEPEVIADKLPPLLEFNIQEVQEGIKRFENRSYILSQVTPKTHIEAMILAAYIYNVNISDSSVPYSDYMKLRECKELSRFVPADTSLREKVAINTSWFDLSIHWEPKLGGIYNQESLKKLCINEGYDFDDFRGRSFEELLYLTRISFNAFYGKNVYGSETTTPIMLEDIEELTNQECMTLGVLDTKELQTYSMNELASLFTEYKSYKNPSRLNETLDKRVVNKIRLYATYCGNAKLLEVMTQVDKWQEYSTEFTERLREAYNKSKTISDILYKVMECGMYMRGWKVVSDQYPLSERATQSKEVSAGQIEMNIHTSVKAVFEYLENFTPEIKKILMELPLYKRTNDKTFIVSPDPDDGNSIFERLQFVISGDKHKNMKSCIRLSSNIILNTVYFYMISLGINEPFDINELDYIS